ncbi:LRR receptor-like serine/threonine-protein kinase FLS2 [Zingiber officinale]|uniref:LRR receptor-like serine/threonine-protein kinase FLS2 n=1 Tax=Zingiber officinale TaxID=94328 RepID=UPI001C4DB9EA|nr:LRR receptor-like serine/threonine-protein kinase FLS2 [Zingiber officinale]
MATAWRSRVRFREPWPLLHPHRCYYLRLVRQLCWLIILAFFLVEVEARVSSTGCLQRERDALLLLKAAIKDPSARLSSWRAQVDCCAWTGVVCYNTTAGRVQVAVLNLQNPNAHQPKWTQRALRGELLHPSLLSLTHLHTLNLSYNDFDGTQIPPLIASLHKLRHLDLSFSNFSGTIPPRLGNLTNLLYLDLRSNNNFAKVLHSPDWLSGLSSLIYLDMSYLNLSTVSNSLVSAVNRVPSLQHLKLVDCSINTIALPLNCQLNLTSLATLDLGFNNFNSSLPNWLWNLTSLSSLHLSHSGIRGAFPDEIGNLISLTNLDLSWNLLSGPLPDVIWKLKHLTYLRLRDNLFGNSLPLGIMNLSSLSTLILNNCSFIGRIPSEFGNLTTLVSLSFAYNSLSGPIPVEIWKLVNLNVLDLSATLLEGDISQLHLSNLTELKACHLICAILMHLNVSTYRTIKYPEKFLKKDQYLQYIHLGNNMLFGEIPSSLGNLMGLEFLHLNNNNLKGHIPSSLQNCTRLLVVDLGDNKLSGSIPLWIGQSWQNLRILQLCSNMFNGNIDPQLGHLRDLQIIDLANNYLSGSIPHSFGNFSTMISASAKQLLVTFQTKYFSDMNFGGSESMTLITKGNQFTFSSILYLVKSIDLSNNNLTGEIPEGLGYLVGLHTLNLSRNYLSGKIPNSIDKMISLETLDLSFNNLSGVIPQGLSELNALSHLNLSYNNLSGNIPSGNQLQTLDDASIYIGNLYLCGDLINKSCFDGNKINMTSKKHIMFPMLSIYLSSTLGYFVGLWSMFVLLLFNEKWRYSYFIKVDKICDKTYVSIKIRLNRIVDD